jgi:hypothetical protein
MDARAILVGMRTLGTKAFGYGNIAGRATGNYLKANPAVAYGLLGGWGAGGMYGAASEAFGNPNATGSSIFGSALRGGLMGAGLGVGAGLGYTHRAAISQAAKTWGSGLASSRPITAIRGMWNNAAKSFQMGRTGFTGRMY